MAYLVSERYKEIIYSGDYSHNLKIWFNGVELENADLYCENLVIKKRIVPEGESYFSLNNFISQRIELTLHDLDGNMQDIINSPIEISIGTLVDDDYEYVPIGTFYIEDKPTTDQDKITITARDATIKFDFGYNAEPIITAHDGSATKKQIFDDICEQVGIETNVTTFIGENDLIGIYDNTVTARKYIADIAEQAGSIAVITRDNKLDFIDILNLTTWEIPLEIVESYKSGINFEVGKVVYESGIIKYETEDSELNTLFLDASNQYVNENTLDLIKDKLIGFKIDSFSTGKILGNPAIDPWDLIKIVDDEKEFITLATYDLTYNGVMTQPFSTELSEEEVESNVSLNKETTFKRWAKTTIDSVEAQVTITAGEVSELDTREGNNYQELLDKFQKYDDNITSIESLEKSVEFLLTNTYTKTQINQIASGEGFFATNDKTYQIDTKYYSSKTLDSLLTEGVDYNIGDEIIGEIYEFGVVSSVITTSGTFDENGMTYEKSGADTSTTINEAGVNVKDSNGNSIQFSGYVNDENMDYPEYRKQTIVGTENIVVRNYLNIGQHTRIQDYENGTGVFYRNVQR